MDCSQAEGRTDAEHSTWAASADALRTGAGRGGCSSSQIEDQKKGEE